jgi:pimeloyl-ACP methyl ester carboxylesterase
LGGPFRRASGWLAALAALLVVGVTLHTVPSAYRDLHPARRQPTEADLAAARRSLPGLEPVDFRTDDGLLLRGWFAPGTKGSAVVLVHGLGANRTELLPEAALLLRRGHSVLVYDSRASGESEGSLATWGDRERRDVAAALRWVRGRPGIEPARVGLYGFSVGASTVALAAAADPAIRAVALGPMWPSLEAELRHRFPLTHARSGLVAALVFRLAGVDVDAVRPGEAIRRIAPRPILFLSGTLDVDTPPAIDDALANEVPNSVRVHVPHAGHGGFFQADPIGLDAALGEFFDRALSRISDGVTR